MRSSLSAFVILLLASGCGLKDAYTCATDKDCLDKDGNAGTCEATKFCSFKVATTECSSGKKYGQFAGSSRGSNLANTCVPSICIGDQVFCGNGCTNVSTDKNNCGSCGTVCPTNQICVNKACTSQTIDMARLYLYQCPGCGNTTRVIKLDGVCKAQFAATDGCTDTKIDLAKGTQYHLSLCSSTDCSTCMDVPAFTTPDTFDSTAFYLSSISLACTAVSMCTPGSTCP